MSCTELIMGDARKIPVPEELDGMGKIKWLHKNGYIHIDDEDLELEEGWIEYYSKDFTVEFGIDNDNRIHYFSAKKVAYANDSFWTLENVKEYTEDMEIVEATKKEEDLYSFVCMWYNGGASFQEVLDEALTKAMKD